MDLWFQHTEASCEAAGITPSYVFVGDKNDTTKDVILVECKRRNRAATYVEILEDLNEPEADHIWFAPQVERMVNLRNILLEEVRVLAPDVFLSLDSDILLAPDTVRQLVETLTEDHRGFAAVGGKTYLGPGTDCVTWATWNRNGGLSRQDAQGIFPVDIIMAIKLMSPEAYNVDYKFEINGEDIGWSFNCRDAGLKLGWNGMTTNKHVMAKGEQLIVDPRVGF